MIAVEQITPPTLEPVTVQELKQQLNRLEPTAQPVQIQSVVHQANTGSTSGLPAGIAGYFAKATLTVETCETGESVTAKVQESSDGISGWTDVVGGAFDVVNESNHQQTFSLNYNGARPYIRVVGETVGTVVWGSNVITTPILSDDDALLASVISAAREEAELVTRTTLLTATWRLTLDEFPGACPSDRPQTWAERYGIELLYPPIQSIDSVSYYDADDDLVVMSASDYVLDTASRPGRLLPAVGTTWPATSLRAGAVIVEYVAGRTTVAELPKTLIPLIKTVAAHLYRHRDEDAPYPRMIERLMRLNRVGSYP